MTEKYEHLTYAKGFTVKCKNDKDIPNIMNYLITGHPLSGHTMEGIDYEIITHEESEGAKALRKAMQITRDHKSSKINNNSKL